MKRRIVVDRIALTLDGLPAAQAQLLAAQLEAALAAQPWPGLGRGHASSEPPSMSAEEDTRLETDLLGPELVRAVAARLVSLISRAPGETPWP